MLLCNSGRFVLSIGPMRPANSRSLPLVALPALLAALAAGCPGKGADGEPPSPAPTSSPPAAPSAARSGYRSRPVEGGHTVEVRVRYQAGADGASAAASTLHPPGWDVPAMVRSQCGGAAKAANDALSVASDGGVDDAVVWLDDIHEGAPVQAATYEQDEKGCSFLPHVLAMPAAGTLKLTNSDPANHAVRFEFKREGQPEGDTFTKTLPPGAVYGVEVSSEWAGQWARITCPIHLWMSSYVHFFEHPYFAVTKAGVARLEKVPPGRYHVRVWHEGIGVTFASSLKFPPPETARAEVAVEQGDAKVVFVMGSDGKITGESR